MIDHRLVKLGKHAPKKDARNLKLARYLTASLPPPPESCDWSAKVGGSWGVMLNDSLGDCTCAAAGHLIEAWTANAGVRVTPPDSAILAAYEQLCGYNPADPSTDGGGVEVDVLNGWRKIGIAGHRIGAYAAVDVHNLSHVKTAVSLFGGVYAGVSLPRSAQGQNSWAVPSGGAVGDGAVGSWGGHAVPVVAYNPAGPVVVTWGALLQVTWAFWLAYFDEAYAIVSPDWLVAGAATPAGVNVEALATDLIDVTA